MVFPPQSIGQVLVDQMYVEKLVPEHPTQPYPLVFITGSGQTGSVCHLPSQPPIPQLTCAIFHMSVATL